ncbi:hypothetical protein [Kitasatospora herbaricolor]|uniref:hypothetical protein n=1 Tax=Kitasatospora herbaricolor TaxID=68217 RepID=UPI002E33A651|nr:hypothetical protein [Kitasatospora herbaricolor]
MPAESVRISGVTSVVVAGELLSIATSGRATDSATAWAELRATRHAPPGHAATGGRSAAVVPGRGDRGPLLRGQV